MAKDRALVPGSSGKVRWSNGANIAFATATNSITLTYQWTRADHSEPIRCRIDVEQTPCHFGGSRPWFLCPECGARVAVVYVRRLPSCRACARLVYPVHSEDVIGRSWRRTHKIEQRLSAGAETWNYGRPKGMRLATFTRLLAARWREEELRECIVEAFVAKMGV